MRESDLLSALFLLACAIFICVISLKEGMGTLERPGSGFFPLWSGIVLGVCSIILAVSNIISKERKWKGKQGFWEGLRDKKTIILVLLSLFLYATLLPWLGYLIATFGVMLSLFVIKGWRPLWVWIGSALILTIVTYVVFYRLLEIQFPRGILGF